MSRPVEQALTNLIPRYSGSLPTELIDLANSLLAQSRNKCSNLKPEEEVARVLKTSLDLPPIEPRPPIPPRVYKQLFAYFDRALISSAARQRARATAGKGVRTPSRALPQRWTPSKEKSLEGFQSQRSAKKGLLFSGKEARDEKVPRWVAPVVRLLCREMQTRRAVPHILAGVESILCLPCPAGQREMEGKIPALVAMVWFFVVIRMRGQGGQAYEGVKRTERVRDVLRGAKDDEGVLERVGEDDGAWAGWEAVEQRHVNAWRKEIASKGWKDLDWYRNIAEGVDVDGDEDAGDEEMPDASSAEVALPEKARMRTGTMIQEQFCVTPAKRLEV
ncbi:Origin recognition complex subunit 6 (ORC6) [Diplocarpon rosae]|nr:Origin recognition complex subunit 6 (ORC6) [Diplocarpon rosae]